MKSRFAKILLSPISWIYGLVVGIRNRLFDLQILPTRQVSVATICVGNLAVGGTGKTPHVEYLIRLLTGEGLKVAVLSRGYKRNTKGFLLADQSTTTSQIGDEPMQIHCKYPDVSVAVCENRYRGIQLLQERVKGIDCIILDDAFQHRALRCGLNIVLTAYDNLYTDDAFLPAGRLRDSRNQISRANMVVVTKCPDQLTKAEQARIAKKLNLPAEISLFYTKMAYGKTEVIGNRPLLLTGIANPHPLWERLTALYPNAGKITYPDHHSFSKRDLDDICRQSEQYSCVITTEKDYQRLRGTRVEQLLGERLLVWPILVEKIDSSEAMDEQILNYVRETLNTK